MADPTDRDAERLSAWLDGDRRDGDDLTDFASRVLRDAALPVEPDRLTTEQRDRLRARVFGGAPHTEKARPTVNAITFAPNGATTAPIPIREPERHAPSKMSVLMTAALVAIIAVAGLGVLRGGIDLPGGSGDPAPTGMPALAFSPVASPPASLNCDRDQWSGIFTQQVPDLLADATYLRYDGDTLTLHCDGGSEQIATGVRQAFTFHTGVVAIRTERDTVQLLNVLTGESLDMASGQLLGDDGTITFADAAAQADWLLVPVTQARADWQVIDLRSMESFLLSDELGGPLPKAYDPEFRQPIGTDVVAVTWRPQGSLVDGTPVAGSEVPRTLLLPGSIEHRRWIDIVDYRRPTNVQGGGVSQGFSVNTDGSLVAYTTVTDTHAPVIRVEDALSGEKLVDVPLEEIDIDTRFILAGGDDAYLVVADGDTVRILGLAPGATREIAEQPGPDVTWFLPTADPETVLFVQNTNYTEITPVDVTSGESREFWMHVPPAYTQVYGDDELPKNLVRVGSVVQLVSVSTGEVVLESEPVDANPVQIVSFTTWLRDGGTLAVVPIGYNRAVVLDAASGETWQIAAPEDDDRLWHFFPSYDGRFVTAYPEPPVGTTDADRSEAWVAPLDPGADWVPLEGASPVSAMLISATPAD